MVKKLSFKKNHEGLWARLAVFMAVILMAGMQVMAQQTPVSYLSPAYKTDGDAKSGIDHWDTLSCTSYTIVNSSQSTWGNANSKSWYVVNSNLTINGNVTCVGDVHLILMDGYTLNTKTIVETGGNGNSFTVYAQSTVKGTMGVLNATGGDSCAGIGGGYGGSGSNITINGGSVTANGGQYAAGIGGGDWSSGSNIIINGGSVTATGGNQGAGIGGGFNGSGWNITINGGNVTANSSSSACIGGGDYASGSNIFIADNIVLKADNNNPPTTVISHASITTDVASLLAGKHYATAEPVPVCINTTTEKPYISIQSAIDDITGTAVIKMNTNWVENVTIASDKTLTLDLNGKTITAQNPDGNVITNNGTLTLIDNVGGGNVTGGAKGVEQNGTLTVGGKLKITSNTANLYMPQGMVFTVGTGDNAPAEGMMVGVSIPQWVSGAIVPVSTANTADYSKYFSADAGTPFIVFADRKDDMKLKITDEVKIILTASPIDGGDVKVYNATTGLEIEDPEHIQYGTLVTIKATQNKEWAFKGWFGNDGMFSGKYEYTFEATENLTLEARFTDEVIWVRVKK